MHVKPGTRVLAVTRMRLHPIECGKRYLEEACARLQRTGLPPSEADMEAVGRVHYCDEYHAAGVLSYEVTGAGFRVTVLGEAVPFGFTEQDCPKR